MAAATSSSRTHQSRLRFPPPAKRLLWDTPAGQSWTGGDGTPHPHPVHRAGGSGSKRPPKTHLGQGPPLPPRAQGDIQRQQGPCHCSHFGGPERRLFPPLCSEMPPPTSLPNPTAADPERNLRGGCPHPLLSPPPGAGGSASPLRRVCPPRLSTAPPPPRLSPCSLTLAEEEGGGTHTTAAGSPRPPLLADGVGSQHRWPCATPDWGTAAYNAPGKDRVPATARGQEQSPPTKVARGGGGQSRGGHRGQLRVPAVPCPVLRHGHQSPVKYETRDADR